MAYIASDYPIDITAGGGTVSLYVSDNYDKYSITGNVTLLASQVIQPTGSPFTNTTFIFEYDATVVLNGNTLTIFGLSLDDSQALQNSTIVSIYNGSTWETKIMPDFENNDIIETRHILDDAVDKDKIAADIAGTGLAQHTDGSLKIATDGVTNAMLATMTTTSVKTADGSGNPQDTALGSGKVLGNIGAGVAAITIDDLIANGTYSNKELIVTEVSFEASEQGINRIFVPYPFEVKHIYFCVQKALAATDAGTLTAKVNGTQIVTTTSPPDLETYSWSASTAINTQGIAADCIAGDSANISLGAGYLDLEMVKTTAGGRVKLSIELERI